MLGRGASAVGEQVDAAGDELDQPELVEWLVGVDCGRHQHVPVTLGRLEVSAQGQDAGLRAALEADGGPGILVDRHARVGAEDVADRRARLLLGALGEGDVGAADVLGGGEPLQRVDRGGGGDVADIGLQRPGREIAEDGAAFFRVGVELRRALVVIELPLELEQLACGHERHVQRGIVVAEVGLPDGPPRGRRGG